MRSAYQGPPPPDPPKSPPRQSKVLTQRQYREREGECFSALRHVIKRLTGEELQTRNDILRKAIDLLSSILETQRQEQVQDLPSPPFEMPSPINPADAALASLDYPVQSSHWTQTWPSTAEFDEHSAYLYARANGRQINPAFEQANHQGYGKSWSDNSQC